ncbi:replication protein A 70 kDa DNA-binding subunit B [Tanacetum coccineum]
MEVQRVLAPLVDQEVLPKLPDYICFKFKSGNGKDKKITPISEVDPMLDDISIKGRCISIWHSHRMNAAHDPYSLDLVLQDVHNTRIQVYIKKEFMFRFEPLFEVGQCYILSNFGITENSGRLPLLPHRYKISFYKCTTVTRIEPFDNNTNGFILEPFNHLLDPEHHQYYENDVVDVIGSVVGIGDIVAVMSAAGKKIRRTIILEDVDGRRLDLTFWDTWASMWDPYANKCEAIEHLVIILQLGKVKYIGTVGIPAIHNALFCTKIFINRNIPEIAAFKKRVQERDGYEANQVKIELFTPEVKVVSIAEFFHGAINRMVGGIRDSEPDSHCIVYARIHRIHKEHGWAYTGCKKCNKKVDILHRQNQPPVYVCEEHGTIQPASRFKVIVRVIDKSGSAPLLFFNNNLVKLSGHTAWELIEKYNMDPDEYWPEELDNIVGKKCLFKLSIKNRFRNLENRHVVDRSGAKNRFKKGESTVEFPDEMIIPESDDYVGSIIAETYPKLLQNLWNPTFFQERAILAPTHEMVDIINERMMALIPGEETIYESSDSVSLVDDDTNFDDSIYTTDFLNGIKMSGLPKHAIKLKIGTPVMLMRNIDQKAGLCNGTRLQVLRMGINVIEGKIISGGSVGKICAIPRLVITPTDTKMQFKLNRRQFPIQICFGMMINKSQGQKLSQVGLFLPKLVFSHGQLYVALSRVKSKQGLKVLCLDKDGNYTNKTTNVVYKEVLCRI